MVEFKRLRELSGSPGNTQLWSTDAQHEGAVITLLLLCPSRRNAADKRPDEAIERFCDADVHMRVLVQEAPDGAFIGAE